MKPIRDCPKCGAALAGDKRGCAGCGWTMRAWRAELAQQTAAADPDCAYEAGGLRCRYPGGVSRSAKGPYYCRWHYYCDDPAEGERLVRESQAYRRPNEEAEFAAEIDESLMRLGLTRRDGESRAEHLQRLRAACRESLANFMRRMGGNAK